VPGVFRVYTRHTSLRAASHRAIGYVRNQHPINAMNPICLNSFGIKFENQHKVVDVVDVKKLGG